MEILGTREAFKNLIQHKGIHKVLGVDKSTVSTWKQYLHEGKNISLDKMEEILDRSGAKLKQDKVWEMPISDLFRGDMLEFHESLAAIQIGDAIEIDTRVHSEIICQNAISRRAVKLNAKVSREDENRPIIKYKFK